MRRLSATAADIIDAFERHAVLPPLKASSCTRNVGSGLMAILEMKGAASATRAAPVCDGRMSGHRNALSKLSRFEMAFDTLQPYL